MPITKYIFAALAIPFTTSLSQATDYDVVFVDTNSGVNWTGVVNTKKDTLSISQWTATGFDMFPKQDSLPMIFNAVTGASGNYDIPDTWDGSLTNWGFVSENAFVNYNWIDSNGGEIGIDLPNTNGIGIGVIETYVEESIIGSGKGATVTPARVDRTYTDSPTMSDPINGRNLTPTTFTASPVPVPEPSSALLLLVGAAGALTRRKR